MNLELDLQIAQQGEGIPAEAQITRWVEAALTGRRAEAELTVRIVDEAEIAALNEHYRGKPGPTNVLSFPFEAPPGIELPLLGDIIICSQVVAREAEAQHKPLAAHWAHMVVHGCLHLLGYDHIDPEEAGIMEGLEIQVLSDLGYGNPYEEGD